MSTPPETTSMAHVVSSVIQSFRRVPPAAVPAMLDCVIASSGLAPSTLLLSLLEYFPIITEGLASEPGKLSSHKRDYLSSIVGAICHLLKRPGESHYSLQLFICKCYIPLMKMMHGFDGEILDRTTESLTGVLVETHTWDVIEASLVPLFLRSVGLSMGLYNDELNIYQWSKCTVFKSSNEKKNISDVDIDSPFGHFPLPLSCYILTSMLDAALQSCKGVNCSSEFVLANGCNYAEKFSVKLLLDLCNMSIQMLSQSIEHRSCAIGSLLPCIFNAFVVQGSFKITIKGQGHLLCRKEFLGKLWTCCKKLFSLGSSERRDAYSVLSLYLSFSFCTAGSGDAGVSNGAEEFDMRAEKDFWNETKRGLVDEEGIVRKQCLHILKTALQINERSECYTGATLHDKCSIQNGMTRRELWAAKEAKSLGVGKICNHLDNCLNGQQRWEAFLLLYEMLEEYGTHLVEAAWNHQINMLLHSSSVHEDFLKITSSEAYPNPMESLEGIYDWLGVLWERGLSHDNPQVRCLVMQSFLGIEWKNLESCVKLVHERFVLGPLIVGLNDPVQHKDFGVKGVFSSRTIEGAAKFYRQYASLLSLRYGIAFLRNFASVAKQYSFGRAGLMGLVKCIASAACGVQAQDEIEAKWCTDNFPDVIQENSAPGGLPHINKRELLDVLRFVIESSKQHFNPKYRLQVCENVLEAAASLVCTFDVPLEALLLFISALPRESVDFVGFLRVKVQEWLLGYGKNHHSGNSCAKMRLLASLYDFLNSFISRQNSIGFFDAYNDEDVDSWECEAKRWAKVLFLVIKEEHDLEPLLMFIQNHGINISQYDTHLEWSPLKFLILILSVVQEIQLMQERTTDCRMKIEPKTEFGVIEAGGQSFQIKDCNLIKKFAMCFLSILEDVVLFAHSSCSIFWSKIVTKDTVLPSSVTGKLGGPSQRRLSSSLTTAVLQAITSMKTVASVSSWCAQFVSDDSLNFAFTFLWKTFWKIISSPACDSETGAEVLVAAYEASAAIVNALPFASSPSALDFVKESNGSLVPEVAGRSLLDTVILTFLQNVNNLLAVGALARSRRAILMSWKWLCLESLLSIADYAHERGEQLEGSIFFILETTARCIFSDVVESLENAGEGSVLPMLRSVRLVLGLFASRRLRSTVSSCDGIGIQMMWQLVRASWILHVNCSKRRVAPIAALLSSVLHPSVFSDENMHGTVDAPGPLTWFVEKLLEEGTKSPRTIRLAALHLTGLWLLNPNTIKYYLKELKLLSFYGSVAFDEDFEAELVGNHDARTEVSLLGKSPDPELTANFINTELFARVSVAVLFYKLVDLTDLVGTSKNDDDHVVHEAGKLFLLELLDSVVNDKDLAKELYKKYSGIHRRKVRAWQMLCILSHFIDQDIIEQVAQSLHICLYKNNFPAVRQYLETFAIHVYLKFPSLAKEQLVAIFRDYEMKPQALSSYVFIAANLILHAPEPTQYKHLDELLPPVIPLLTSHHHSLRCFTQVLVYQVLCKLLPSSTFSESMPLEKRCFEDLKFYLAENSDCMRLRTSMIGYLDAFNPKLATTPAGIFSKRIEELEFECVPTSLMEQVTAFLNDVREDLRCSMAKNLVSMKNESLMTAEDLKNMETTGDANKKHSSSQHVTLNFQKKATLSKNEHHTNSSSSGSSETYNQLLDIEKEDLLLEQLLTSRSLAMEKIKASRQHIILVASLIDRIPNLAGLARTCEVFKAAGLAVADANILHDKQFQLISVTAEKWVPLIEVPVHSMKFFLEKKKQEGFSILGLEQTANSIPLDQYIFPKKTVLVLGHEKGGIPVDIIHILDACVEIPQFGVVRSLNVHVSGAIALWEYTRQQRFQ